jgi:hypothetical protein
VPGAVAARMRVHDSGLCFVGAHLSSGESEGDDLKRNFDYAEIVRRAAFPSDSMSVDPEALSAGNPNGQAGVSKVGHPFCDGWAHHFRDPHLCPVRYDCYYVSSSSNAVVLHQCSPSFGCLFSLQILTASPSYNVLCGMLYEGQK